MCNDGLAPRDLAFFVSFPGCFRADPVSWPITRRQAVARELAAYLDSAPFEDGLREIVQLMAADSAPMVRREAAELLPLLPDDLYEEMAGMLGADHNRYVKDAARRAAERRGKGVRKTSRLRKDVLEVQERFDRFADEYGARASRRARRMANDLFETLVGATLHNLVGFLPGMRMSLETLQRHFDTGKPSPAQCRAKLDGMSRQLDCLKTFADDMRLFAKAKPKNRTSVRLAEVVDEAVGIVLGGLESPDVLNIQTDECF